MKCQEVCKVLKERKLQSRILHPERLLFKIEGDKDFPRQAKTTGVHNHETHFIRNIKGSSLCRKGHNQKQEPESLPRSPRNNTLSGSFQVIPGHGPISSTRNNQKRRSQQANLLGPIPLHVVTLHSNSYTVVGFNPNSQPV